LFAAVPPTIENEAGDVLDVCQRSGGRLSLCPEVEFREAFAATAVREAAESGLYSVRRGELRVEGRHPPSCHAERVMRVPSRAFFAPRPFIAAVTVRSRA